MASYDCFRKSLLSTKLSGSGTRRLSICPVLGQAMCSGEPSKLPAAPASAAGAARSVERPEAQAQVAHLAACVAMLRAAESRLGFGAPLGVLGLVLMVTGVGRGKTGVFSVFQGGEENKLVWENATVGMFFETAFGAGKEFHFVEFSSLSKVFQVIAFVMVL